MASEPEECPKYAKARPRQTDHTPRQSIHDQVNIIERIKGFYTELYDSESSTIIHIDQKAALRDMRTTTT